MPKPKNKSRIDARIGVNFRNHPKRVKLQRRLGPVGVLALVDLILFASESRTNGVLTGMSAEDIAIAAQWTGDAEELVAALVSVGFLDRSEHGEFALHDWYTHNPHAARTEERQHLAAINSHVGWLKRKGIACSIKRCEFCKAHADRKRVSQIGNPPPRHSPLATHHSPLAEEESKALRPKRASDEQFADDSRELKASKYLHSRILQNNPEAKVPNFQSWARVFDLIFRIDRRDPGDVRSTIDWSQKDSFWHKNILSPSALRKSYDRLRLAMKSPDQAVPRSRPVFVAPHKD